MKKEYLYLIIIGLLGFFMLFHLYDEHTAIKIDKLKEQQKELVNNLNLSFQFIEWASGLDTTEAIRNEAIKRGFPVK